MSDKTDKLNPLLSGHGTVEVGGLLITITPLSAHEELLLGRELRRRASQYYGSPYSRIKSMLAEMSEAERVLVLQEMTRAAIRQDGLSWEALDEFATTNPDWVAYELYRRGRAATPGLTYEGLRAIINDSNVAEVAARMRQATLISTSDDKKSSSA